MEKLDNTNLISILMPDGSRVSFDDYPSIHCDPGDPMNPDYVPGPHCPKGPKGPRWDPELGRVVEDPGCWDEDE